MTEMGARRIIIAAGIFIGVLLGVRFLLPVILPFLLGLGLALLAEPMVSKLHTGLKLPRALCSGIGVTVVFLLALMLLTLLVTVAYHILGSLALGLPQIMDQIGTGTLQLKDWLLSISQRTPDGIRELLVHFILQIFSGGTSLLQRVSERVIQVASGMLTGLPEAALLIGTGILSSYMISAKLPQIRKWLSRRVGTFWNRKGLPDLRSIGAAVGGWLHAQARLMLLTFLIVASGLFLLRIPFAPLWASLIALVDAAPILGTGTVMIPWSLICFLEGDTPTALGLLATYAAASIMRTVLEPRMVGKQLGLDPLLTLAALYVGFRVWGIAGMILSPLLAAVTMEVISPQKQK